MSFEADQCQLRTVHGELVARGFVREQARGGIVIDAQTLAGTWFDEGDEAVVEVFDPDRGSLTYRAVVDFAAAKRIRLVDLRLQEVRQQRSALRVPTDLTVTVIGPALDPQPADQTVDQRDVETPEEDREPQAEEYEAWQATLVDLSAHGLRLVTAEDLQDGSRWRVVLGTPRGPLELVAEVVRSHELRGQVAYGCRIVGATEREHDLLFSWVLHLQRRLLARRAPTR